MRVLALDTSTPTGSIAVLSGDQICAEVVGDPAKPHAQRLPLDLLTAIAAAGLTIADIDLFAVAVGPGSFTGLRIGIAAIQGLAVVTGRRLVAVSLLDALAQVAAADQPPGARIAAWIDAHRGDVYSALYAVAEAAPVATARLTLLDPPRVDRPEVVLEAWQGMTRPPYVAIGDGALLYAERLRGQAIVCPAPPLAATVARLAVERAANGGAVAPETVQPLYIRRPDVEVARDRLRHG
jgi:tRNA threonylcarbamoyladenosine biosynthesis protein TsaB